MWLVKRFDELNFFPLSKSRDVEAPHVTGGLTRLRRAGPGPPGAPERNPAPPLFNLMKRTTNEPLSAVVQTHIRPGIKPALSALTIGEKQHIAEIHLTDGH